MNKMAAYFGRDLVKSKMKGKGQKQTALDPGGVIVRGVGVWSSAVVFIWMLLSAMI